MGYSVQYFGNFHTSFRDIEYLGILIMGILANLLGILACLLHGIWDIWYPPPPLYIIQASLTASRMIKCAIFRGDNLRHNIDLVNT